MTVPFLSLRDVTARYKDEIHKAALRVIDSGWYLQGKENAAFEAHYAEYCGARYCVGCANGLDALIWIIRGYKELGRLHDGDEVIVPANTYIASILAITENGLTPILVEPREETLEIDDDLIESSITSKTKAILIVHLYGRNAYTEKIGMLCREHHLLLIQDCAQCHGLRPMALGSEERRVKGEGCELLKKDYRSEECPQLPPLGGIEGGSAHSFYPGKNLGALGDGGAVTTDDEELALAIRALANYGSQRKYVFKYAGRNSRLDEIQAAILDVKLRHLDDDVRQRQRVAAYYYEHISNPLVTLPKRLDDKDNVYHLFPILIKGTRERDRMQQYLTDNGIGTVIHYPIPPHHQECYAHEAWNTPRLSLPVTERLAMEELSIPMSPCLTQEEVEYVVKTINDFK